MSKQGRQGHGAPRGLLALEVAQEHRRAEGQRRHGDVRRHAEELHVVGLHREGNTRREEGREAHARLAPGVDLGRLLGVEARVARSVGHPRGRRREAHEAEGNQARPREGGVGDVLEIPLEGLPLGGRRRAVARAEEVRVALQLEARGPHREHGHDGSGHRRRGAKQPHPQGLPRAAQHRREPDAPEHGHEAHKRARCRYRQREACAADGHARDARAVVATPQGHHEPRQGQRGRALRDAPAVHRARVEEHQRQRGVGDARVHGEATIARGARGAHQRQRGEEGQHGAGQAAPHLRGVAEAEAHRDGAELRGRAIERDGRTGHHLAGHVRDANLGGLPDAEALEAKEQDEGRGGKRHEVGDPAVVGSSLHESSGRRRRRGI